MEDARGRFERYNLAWVLSEAFGGKEGTTGREDGSRRQIKPGHKEVSWDEFKKYCKGYKGGSVSSKSG